VLIPISFTDGDLYPSSSIPAPQQRPFTFLWRCDQQFVVRHAAVSVLSSLALQPSVSFTAPDSSARSQFLSAAICSRFYRAMQQSSFTFPWPCDQQYSIAAQQRPVPVLWRCDQQCPAPHYSAYSWYVGAAPSGFPAPHSAVFSQLFGVLIGGFSPPHSSAFYNGLAPQTTTV
jgi:hypothetical protein